MDDPGRGSGPSRKAHNRRKRVLDLARRLARSGVHADHRSILPLLEGLEGFADVRGQLTDPVFQAQLDRLCIMARAADDGRRVP
ncbi:MAG TPA: hypothetical protein VHL98_01015 [Microvirga sp.]|nr:hypothetical protein [Microvirga sp.]